MSGFGGSWKRHARGDIERYPEFKRWLELQTAGKMAVSNFTPPCVTGEIRYIDPQIAASEAREFKAALAVRKGAFSEAFLTAPSPGIIAAACKNEHYATDAAYLDALESHVTYLDQPEAKFLGFVESVVGTINRALRNIPRDRARMHVCWGNYEGPHDCDVPLRKIWPLIRQARVGGFVLPFANARHAHEMKVLRQQPLADDQVIVAGVIDVTTNFVEHPEVVADRLERVAAEVGDPHRVLGGTDCGFDSAAGMGRVASDVVWAKLRALSEGARIASAKLLN
jgi:5-methyltetrahydropteroyltriglutamate--homocysteine methyltransferase